MESNVNLVLLKTGFYPTNKYPRAQKAVKELNGAQGKEILCNLIPFPLSW